MVRRGLVALALLAGCSAGSGPNSKTSGPSGATGNTPGGSASTPGQPSLPGGGSLSIDVGTSGSSSGGSSGSAGMVGCATQQAGAAIERQPVDIIVVIDNSGSMQE